MTEQVINGIIKIIEYTPNILGGIVHVQNDVRKVLAPKQDNKQTDPMEGDY
jgi:hypothetical protein